MLQQLHKLTQANVLTSIENNQVHSMYNRYIPLRFLSTLMCFSTPLLFVRLFIYKAHKLIEHLFFFLNGSLEVMWHMVFSCKKKTISDMTWEFSLIQNAIV